MQPIILSAIAEKKEKSAVTRHIQEEYLERFGTLPSEAETYIVGRREERIMGTIGFELPSEAGHLSIPHAYDFDETDVPPELTRETVCQSNRWTSEDPDLSIALVYAVCLLAQMHKKEHIWIEQTPSANRLLTRSGMRFHRIPSAVVVLERIHEKDRAYYRDHGPKPCIMLPSQVIAALSRRMHRHVASGKISFDISIL